MSWAGPWGRPSRTSGGKIAHRTNAGVDGWSRPVCERLSPRVGRRAPSPAAHSAARQRRRVTGLTTRSTTQFLRAPLLAEREQAKVLSLRTGTAALFWTGYTGVPRLAAAREPCSKAARSLCVRLAVRMRRRTRPQPAATPSRAKRARSNGAPPPPPASTEPARAKRAVRGGDVLGELAHPRGSAPAGQAKPHGLVRSSSPG
jgi:hypothetical protein